MGAAVLTHLRRLVVLPERGFVAGQAVASSLDDLYGAGGGVYNDVDVFIRAPSFTTPRERLVLLPSRFTTQLCLQPAPGAAYDHLALRHTVISAPTYTISGVRRRDLLNEVFYTTSKVLGPLESARCVLTSFDINAVHVGVDIATGELVWDLAFEHFARTSELRLCALHTPYHSLVRLLRKQQELPRVTVNAEASASLVGLLSTPGVRRSIEMHKAATFWFGAKYAEQAQAVRRELSPYFSLRTEHRYFDDVTRRVKKGFGDETNAPYELSTLVRRGEPAVTCSPSVGDSLVDMLALPAQVYAKFDATSRSSIVVPAIPWKAAVAQLPALDAQQQLFGPGYFDRFDSAAQARTLAKALTPRLGVANLLKGLDGVAQLEWVTRALAFLESEGVPDVDHILNHAVFHSVPGDGASWLQGCELVLKQERARQLGKVSFAPVLDEAVWAEWPDAKIVHLATERLMREWCIQNHWETPLTMSGYLWLGVSLGRHARDTSMVRLEVDRSTGMLTTRGKTSKRVRMPVALQESHKRLYILLRGYARTEGWFDK
jgi:hypothetical protein